MRRRRGTSPTLITPSLLRRWPLPVADGARGKDGRGKVCVVGGCLQVPGAVVLSATAALRVGTGRVEIATVRAVAPTIGVSIPEIRAIGLPQDSQGELSPVGARRLTAELEEQDAVLIGPGMGPASGAAAHAFARACRARRHGGPALVLDAGGLLALARGDLRGGSSPIIVTPHNGEMARLSGETLERVRARPLETARESAKQLGLTVVMKGEKTFVASAGGAAFLNEAGAVGLGTPGSGDVLAGIIAGLCARGASADQAAVWGVYLHAKAGERLSRRIGTLGFTARELLDELPRLMDHW